LATGRVLQFDQERGYGFIAADDGGEDVFLHASVFDGDSYELAPGMRVEFKIMAGDRGRKAFAAHLIPDEPDPEGRPAPTVRPDAAAQPVPAPAVPAPAVPAPAMATPPSVLPAPASDEDQMCDVLSQAEFGHELVELLLNDAPGLTGKQITEVRQGVLEIAKKHGWIDI
jgi:cold shock protein